MSSPAFLEDLARTLAQYGLRLRGGFALAPETDGAVLAHAVTARTLLLVGNVGSELWRRSGPTIEARGDPDPLDRWTRETIQPIAAGSGGTALFPFDGPPYWPFQRWAQRAEGVWPSPLGILIHPVFGLWHAYRAAILLPLEIELPGTGGRNHPCDTCRDRPCLSACPANAFSDSGYDVDHCVAHVAATRSEDRACLQQGCLARLACPIGPEWRYAPDHAEFHMQAFLTARLGAFRKS